MKRLLTVLLFLFASSAYSQTCTVSGNINDYSLYGMKTEIVVKEVRRTGKILPIYNYPVPVASNGAFSFKVPQTIGTDTTKVRIFINSYGWQGDFKEGVWVAVPSGATATLTDLSPTTYYSPPTYAVMIPLMTFVDSTGGTYNQDSLRFAKGLRLIRSSTGGPPTLISEALADTTGYFARYGGVMTESDPTALPIATAARDTARNASQRLDAVEAEMDTLQDAAVASLETENKNQADTLTAHKTALDTKQNVLSAAQIARIDSMLAAGNFVTITSQGGIRIISVDTTGWFARYGGVMAESDPTAQAKISAALDSAFTAGARSMSSNGRIVALEDSITLTVAPNETIDLSTGNNCRLTLTADDTLALSGGIDGQVIQVTITNGGTHTLTWSGINWPSPGTQPTTTATAGKVYVWSFIKSGGMYRGVVPVEY